jgi:glycosyltransferase involved in cell wall biosynthesis
MAQPLISCIVPVYNGERYLRDALESILAQTYRPLELIVVDDGSADRTAEIVANFRHEIACIRQANLGPSAARNVGLRAADGEFVAFLDQDDLWHAEKLERQMARFRVRPALDLCITRILLFWEPGLQREAERFRGHQRSGPVPGYTTTTLLARKAAFDTVGQLDPALWFGAAADWFLRAAERGMTLELLPDVLVYHRMHDTNLTRRQCNGSREEFLQIVKKNLDRRRQSGGSAGTADAATGLRSP